MISTIFSIQNSMVGASSVVIPQALAKTGIIPGFITVFLLQIVNCQTCILVAKQGQKQPFTDVVEKRCGMLLRNVWNLSTFISASIVSCVQSIIFSQTSYVLLTNIFNYKSTLTIQDANYQNYNIVYHKLICSVVIFILVFTKDLSLIVKITGIGAQCLITTIVWFSISQAQNFSLIESDSYVDNLYGEDEFYLIGIMLSGQITHPGILPILHINYDHQKLNIFIAYTIAFFTYIQIGLTGQFTFYTNGRNSYIDNVFNIYEIQIFGSMFLTNIVRVINCIQYITLIPLIVTISRSQMQAFIWNDKCETYEQFRNWSSVQIIVNISINMFFPRIGMILNYSGCILGLCITTIVPILTNISALLDEDKSDLLIVKNIELDKLDKNVINGNKYHKDNLEQTKISFLSKIEIGFNIILLILMFTVSSQATQRNIFTTE